MKKLKVKLQHNPYDIIISEREYDFLFSFRKYIKSKSIFIITDTAVAKLHLNSFEKMLRKAGYVCKSAIIKAGETGKNLKSLSFLYDKALACGIDRKSCVIAFGGGVVGDVVGFFAGTYMRGIALVQVPTTLLAMTDSSIGGKTAINTSGGKNIAGVFYQPLFVWINTSYLSTLPAGHIRNGMAEIIKYALTFDKNFYDYLLSLFSKGFISLKDFDYMIYKSCTFKAAIVEKDEKETKGLREVLNFGHTLAHALETYTDYKKFLHGEAVAAGMLFAALLSYKLTKCKKETFIKTNIILKEAGFNFNLSAMNAEKLAVLMTRDKKSIEGKIRFVLLKDIGKSVCGIIADSKKILKILKNYLKENKWKKYLS
ncbi:MAG: 3-dehydroquinate synthase [Endomicrobium sp.]|jgi:3-dehydroquinate synthase|nr:3-dehydroquinate synthase [Endomicrobium sp.]